MEQLERTDGRVEQSPDQGIALRLLLRTEHE
jgi:hypothetical protein